MLVGHGSTSAYSATGTVEGIHVGADNLGLCHVVSGYQKVKLQFV